MDDNENKDINETEIEVINCCYEVNKDLKVQYFFQMCLLPLFKACMVYCFSVVAPFLFQKYLVNKFDLTQWIKFFNAIRIGLAYLAIVYFRNYFNKLLRGVEWWLLSLRGDLNRRFRRTPSTAKYLSQYSQTINVYLRQIHSCKTGNCSSWITCLYVVIGCVLYNVFFVRGVM